MVEIFIELEFDEVLVYSANRFIGLETKDSGTVTKIRGTKREEIMVKSFPIVHI